MKQIVLVLLCTIWFVTSRAQGKGAYQESPSPANNEFHIFQVSDVYDQSFFMLGMRNKNFKIALFDGEQNKWYEVPLPYPDADIIDIVHYKFISLVALVREKDGNKLYHWRKNKWVQLSAPKLDGRIYSIAPLGTSVNFVAIGDFKNGSENFHYARFFDGSWEKHTLEGATDQVKQLLTNGKVERTFLARRFYTGLIVADTVTKKRFVLYNQRQWKLIGEALPGPVWDVMSDLTTYVCGLNEATGFSYFVKSDDERTWDNIDLDPSSISSVQKILTLGNDGKGALVNGFSKNGKEFVLTGIVNGQWRAPIESPGTILKSVVVRRGLSMFLSGEKNLVRPRTGSVPQAYVVIPAEMEIPYDNVFDMRNDAKKKKN